MLFEKTYGIDLGSSSVKVYSLFKNKSYMEKNMIASRGHKIIAVGNEAYEMFEKSPAEVAVCSPMSFGMIANLELQEIALYSMMKKIDRFLGIGSDMFFSVPLDMTAIEKRAYYHVANGHWLRQNRVYMVEAPIADAIAMGVDLNKNAGSMIVNIGAETTEISVLSLGGIVISKAVKIGGNKLDDCIISNVRKAYNLVIGSKTAENLKKQLGSAVPVSESFAPGFGRNVLSGLPVSVDISSDIIYQAIIDSLHSIMDAIKVILERTPPELAADIIKDGVYFTGGTSQINNLEKYIKDETNLNVNIVEHPAESVVRGLMGVVSNPEFAKVAYTPTEKNFD